MWQNRDCRNFHWKYLMAWIITELLTVTRAIKWYHSHDDIIKWKHFPRHWPFVRGIHRSPVNSPHKSQWRGALMFSLICTWINAWVNNRGTGDLRHHRAHYDAIVMVWWRESSQIWWHFLGPLSYMIQLARILKRPLIFSKYRAAKCLWGQVLIIRNS